MTRDKENKKVQSQEPPTATDIYANTDYRTKDAKVAIPTKESVDDAKDWVDNENPK